MILSTDKLKIRPWKLGDEPSLARYANNRKISINLRDRFPYPYTEQDARDWVTFASASSPLINFAIEAGGEAVGGIGIIPGTDVFRRTAELGYWLGEPFWGKGLMTDAVTLVVPYFFRQFNLVRVFAGVFDRNPASGRVLEKAGFVLESRMRKAVVKDGEILDQLMYVMVR
jgi:ribosomal-protein-alanine N-acetyltransferase